MRDHVKGLLILVVPTMAFGWIVVAGTLCYLHITITSLLSISLPFYDSVGVMSLMFPDLTFVSCLAIAACLTSTDPVICAAIVGLSANYPLLHVLTWLASNAGGKYAMEHVPENLRHILAAEAAANDGLAIRS